MHCAYCGDKIRLIRMLRDRSFCSEEHRRSMAKVSARAVRDADSTDWEHPWMPLLDIPVANAKVGARPVVDGAGASVALLLAAFAALAVAPEPAMRILGERARAVSEWYGREAGTPFREFQVSSANAVASTWTALTSRQGTLRLWPETVGKQNYQVQVSGDLGKGSVACVFRAVDARNYYAAKVRRAGKDGTMLERWAVVNGGESGLTSVPIESQPRAVQLGVAARDDHFVLSVNGRVVDSWRDPRFPVGGAGVLIAKGAAPIESARLRVELPQSSTSRFWSTMDSLPHRLARLIALAVRAR